MDKSGWVSPIALTGKKDGSIRMCMDYRCLNGVDPLYPMPQVDDQLDKLGGMKCLTTLDLSHGLCQVPN